MQISPPRISKRQNTCTCSLTHVGQSGCSVFPLQTALPWSSRHQHHTVPSTLAPPQTRTGTEGRRQRAGKTHRWPSWRGGQVYRSAASSSRGAGWTLGSPFPCRSYWCWWASCAWDTLYKTKQRRRPSEFIREDNACVMLKARPKFLTCWRSCQVPSSSPRWHSFSWPWRGNIPSAVLRGRLQARSSRTGGWHCGGGYQKSLKHSQSGWKGWQKEGSDP